jgi:quercetin dioxygenase-like cupin family protein
MAMQHTLFSDTRWRPAFDGVDLAPLNLKDGKGSFLLRFKAGSVCPLHDHPGGEEIYVVSGRGRLNALNISAGDFIKTPPGESHTLHAETALLIHVITPEAVVFAT